MKAESKFSYQAPELEEAKFGTFFEGPSVGVDIGDDDNEPQG